MSLPREPDVDKMEAFLARYGRGRRSIRFGDPKELAHQLGEIADWLDTLVLGEKTMSEKMKKEIARRFAAAFISYAHGIKMDYAYKKYVGDEPVGELWQQLASLAIEGWREMQGDIVALTPLSSNDKGKIQ